MPTAFSITRPIMSKHYDICILGGGISGLSSAALLCRQKPQATIGLLEKKDSVGGAVRSFKKEGYLAEWGPHGFLDNCEESRELIQLAGLETEKELAPLNRFVRYVCLDGKLQCIPQKPLTILRQPLIPLHAKLRILGDLWQPPLPGEPTVAQWVAHRFGPHLLPFADAAFTGTYAGDINTLRMDAVMPGVRNLEHTHGSVLRGLLRSRPSSKAARTKKRKKGLPSMTSFTGGMGRLPEALADMLLAEKNVNIRYNTKALSITQQKGTWTVHTPELDYTCADLILALPINTGLSLLGQCPHINPPPFDQLPEAAIATILLGFDASAEIPFGFGYLAPEQEKRFLLGTLFSSQMFSGRAPQGLQLVEALVGGRRHPERLQLEDEELITRAYQDLKSLMPLPTPPLFAQVLRPTVAIPQLEEQATALFRWREEVHATTPSLHICGFGWKGIGLNDMVKEGAAMAARCLHTDRQQPPEVKAVYL
ncbi:MAG: protoporphyrinogen oxidase [Desulfobulbus propionicus]|nr:MAG: protoporphyrinogen oxidase [Desulfobulbus propionicus]